LNAKGVSVEVSDGGLCRIGSHIVAL